MVTDTWEQVRRITNWETVAGEMFTRKIFELDSDTITMFGIPADTKYDDSKLSDKQDFYGHVSPIAAGDRRRYWLLGSQSVSSRTAIT